MASRAARSTDAIRLRPALLRWFDTNQRDLPWRHSRDPYAIWVSEIMLQQTRVDTVVRYYDRFLARFPTTHALAQASEDEVMSAWSGLGYYRRARLLHQGVREVVARYGGHVPEEAEQRRALPGVGRYTAGAIGSIAFDREEPIVDGNVARVLCRIDGIDTPLGRADTERALWQQATRWAQGERPGAVNQALMELGATICTPRVARCDQCPLRVACAAHASNRVEMLPVARVKAAPVEVELSAVIAASASDRVWLQRSESGLFAGLWSMPMIETTQRAEVSRWLKTLGLHGRLSTTPLANVEHVLTHRRLRVQLWRLRNVQRDDDTSLRADLRDMPLAQLSTLGTSRLTSKLLAASASLK